METKQRLSILEKLAEVASSETTEGKAAIQALEREAEKLSATLQSMTDYHSLDSSIELLDRFAYRLPEKAFAIINALLIRLPTIDLTYRELMGIGEERLRTIYTKDRLTVGALKVLKRIRYHVLEKNIILFLEYTTNDSEEVRKQARDCLNAIAEFDIDVFFGNDRGWSGLGALPQEQVLARLESMSNDDIEKYFDGVVTLADCLLSPSIGGTSWSYNRVTWRTVATPAMPAIESIRERTLRFLYKSYSQASAAPRKRAIANVLNTATRSSHAGRYGEDVRSMITKNALQVLEMYQQIASDEADLEIIQHIEHIAYWLQRSSDDETIQIAALAVKDVIDLNPEYQIFKVLIGYEGVFAKWERKENSSEDEDDDYKAAEKIRNRRAQEFADSITIENFAEWKDRILRYAAIESQDLATFPFFVHFLERFAKASPVLALDLLQTDADRLTWFATFVISGIWETAYRGDLRSRLKNWVSEGKYLVETARIFESRRELDLELLTNIFEKAKAVSARETAIPPLRCLIAVIASNYDENRKELLNTFFLQVVNELTARGDSYGVQNIWFRKEVVKIITDMSAPMVDALMQNLALAKKIDYQAEQILVAIAEKSPEKVVEFFGRRLATANDFAASDYEAFPFKFHSLEVPLSRIPERLVDIVSGWYDGDYGRFIYRGARFLSNIFPHLTEVMQEKLIEYVQSGDLNKINFVLAVLRNYEGEKFIHPVCKALIKALPYDSIDLREVTVILMTTGVVTGAHGFAEAYERKREEVTSWLSDPDDTIRSFAEQYIDSLAKSIDSERNRADEDLTLRKFKYGVDKED